jgi:carboxyl-terminal processing protease
MKNLRLFILLFAIVLLSGNIQVHAQLTEKERFEVSKYLDIYNALFKELNLNYVDSLKIGKLISDDIAYMLRQLDPYTQYIPEEEMPEFRFETTGEYGGVGSIISMRDNKIIILEPYEGMPAALSGLIPGDQILAIDGESLVNQTVTYASERLKGQPNTEVKIKFQRLGEDKPREIILQRQRIHIEPITYYGVIKDKIGYISLSGFTTQSAQAVKEALLDLTTNHQIESLIFDVRDNGGGVVEECLDMLNFFLPKGELLLSMKGRVKQMERTYHATQEPILPNLPLVVLTNGNSASAAEILAGSIQDLDRGIVVGTRTFGKGVVQATYELPYNGQLKLTVSKYYIPSGRCIQAIDYAQRDGEGRVTSIPDSLTNIFYTANNRPVRDGSGILPDFVIADEKVPTIIYYMDANYIFFNFVTQWRKNHPKIASPFEFELTNKIYEEFKSFVASKDFSYDRQSERAMESLKKIMEFEGYFDGASEEFQALENKLKPDLNRDLELYKSQIANYLAMQMMKQYHYEKGRLIYDLRKDQVLNKALEILQDKELYVGTLKPKED